MVESPFYGKAGDMMTRKVVTVSPDTSIRETASLMAANHVSGVPVVDKDGQVVGMVTEKDLIRNRMEDEKRESWWLNLLAEGERLTPEFVEYARAGNNMVRRVMHTEITSVSEDTPLEEIARLMVEKGLKRFPVVKDKKLVGVISRADLVRALGHRSTKEGVI
jgi:CBS domain-containing protein